MTKLDRGRPLRLSASPRSPGDEFRNPQSVHLPSTFCNRVVPFFDDFQSMQPDTAVETKCAATPLDLSRTMDPLGELRYQQAPDLLFRVEYAVARIHFSHDMILSGPSA